MINSHPEEFVWATKYRPRKVVDAVLPKHLKDTFQSFVDKKAFPNLVLSGSPGIGKTTVAKAMASEIGSDVLMINSSLNGNVDTLRNEISQFASTVSFQEGTGRKLVILDEADHLTGATQAGLRTFMEEFSITTAFILTCNYPSHIIEPLRSRCAVIDFYIPKEERATLAAEFTTHVVEILDIEGVKYNIDAVAALIKKHFPDWRRVLVELQKYASSGNIDTGILAVTDTEDFATLIGLLKSKKWADMRAWIGQHSDVEPNLLLRKFYDSARTIVQPASLPSLVLLLADTQYKLQFSADPEICMAAFLTHCMTELSFR